VPWGVEGLHQPRQQLLRLAAQHQVGVVGVGRALQHAGHAEQLLHLVAGGLAGPGVPRGERATPVTAAWRDVLIEIETRPQRNASVPCSTAGCSRDHRGAVSGGFAPVHASASGATRPALPRVGGIATNVRTVARIV
jgi:hypothetical protein